MRRAWQIASQSPHVPIVGYLVAVGVVGIITRNSDAPPEVAAAVPAWLLWTWSLSLTVGGLIAIIGTVTERSRAESFGLAFCLSGMFLYLVAYRAGVPAVVALTLMIASRLWVLHKARQTHAQVVRFIDREAS